MGRTILAALVGLLALSGPGAAATETCTVGPCGCMYPELREEYTLATPAATFYVADDNESFADLPYVYMESNGREGLQRGGPWLGEDTFSPFWYDWNCHQPDPDPDLFLF